MNREEKNKYRSTSQAVDIECWKCGGWYATYRYVCPYCKEPNEEAEVSVKTRSFGISKEFERQRMGEVVTLGKKKGK